MQGTKKLRILFFAEGVTMVHVARPLFLAQILKDAHHTVQFACDPDYHWMVKDRDLDVTSINSIPPERFMDSLHNSTPLLDEQTLRSQIFEDIDVIRKFEPDLIIEDFRLSLSISAAFLNVPCISITKGSWRTMSREKAQAPNQLMTKLFGSKLGQALFNVIIPADFSGNLRNFNDIKRNMEYPRSSKAVA